MPAHKIYRIFMFSVIIIIILFSVIGCNGYSEENKKNDEMYYRTGIGHFEYEEYEHAIKYLSNVTVHSKHYKDAVKKIKEAEKIVGKQQHKQNDEIPDEKDYQAGIKAIKAGNWDYAAMMLVLPMSNKHKDGPVLYAYVFVEKMLIEKDFRMMLYYLKEIPDTYQGDLADVVLQRKQVILNNIDKLEEEMREQTEIKEKERKLEMKERIRPMAQLEIEMDSFKWYKSSSSHVRAEGEVKNISDVPLRSVVAVITYKTKEGDFITFDSALIEYNPIMPDQISPFRVISTYNPLMETAHIEFQFHLGDKILTIYE